MSNENYELTLTATDKATVVVQKFTDNLERTLKPVRDLEKAMQRLGKVSGVENLSASLRHIRNGANDAAQGIRSIVPPIAAITGVGTLAGIAALVTGFAKMTVHSQNSAAILGVSTSELLRWQGAARLAGASAESMQSSLEGIGTAFNAAATIDPAKGGILRSVGVQVHRTQDGSVDVQRGMLDLADVFQKHTNAQYRIQLADALGISHDLIPLLARGRKAIEDFYAQTAKLALSPEQQQAADAYNRSLVNLDFSATKLRNTFGADLAPSLQVVINTVQGLVDKYGEVVASDINRYVKELADWTKRTDWARVADDVGKFVDSIGGAKGVAEALAAITFIGPIASAASLVASLVQVSATATGLLTLLARVGAASATGTAAAEVAAGVGGGGILLGADGLIARFAGSALGRASLGAGLLLHSENLNTGEGAYLNQRRTAGDREKYLAAELTQAGYTKPQAAGIIGSLLQEDSTLDPKNVNPVSGARGIAQWLGPRAAGFQKLYGTDLAHSTFEQQVGYMIHELKTTESAADRRIRWASDPVTAARAHAMAYERPGAAEANLDKRAAYARDVYADLFGGAPMSRKTNDTPDNPQTANGPSDKLDESQFQIVDTAKEKLDERQFQIVDLSADKPPQTFHFHITGLPAGASVRAKSTTPGVTVAATVGQSSLGHDNI